MTNKPPSSGAFSCYHFLMLPKVFLQFAKRFEENGFALYMIGGSSRDYLLGIPSLDLDLVTDAKPEEVAKLVEGLDMTFARFGSVKKKVDGLEVDFTTMRREGEYKDHRHPSHIEFIDSMEEDSLRRDFTVNALYIDAEGKVHDFHGGLADLKAKRIRFIGDPKKRIEEDPLRILRAERFAKRLGFEIEEASQKAMDENRGLLRKLNPEKVKLEKRKE